MLTVHRAERADRLVEALASVMADPPDDVFTPEIVSVPTRGVERWLTQRLSARLGTTPGRKDGVCANLQLPFPGRLVGEALAGATGIEHRHDPWRPERSVWPLIAVVDEHLGDHWMGPLAAHLGATDGGQGVGGEDGITSDGRFAVVRHLSDLFDHYGVHRPSLIEAWAAGDDTDGQGRPLPPDATWQAELWRRLRERLAVPSPAERLAGACARLRDEPGCVDLPGRVSLFGLTRLPTSFVQVLAALAAARDAHLFLLHPSPALWDEARSATADLHDLTRRRDDPTTTLVRNPLSTTWGRDAREMQIVLAAAAGPFRDVHHPLPDDARTLLERLQADVRADAAPPGPPRPGGPDARHVLEPSDRSIQVHACHGRARQVEVLRDAILQLLADDATLEPRDVIVMCPDIEAFAPLIHATFGIGDAEVDPDRGDDRPSTAPVQPDLRVRLADRSLRQTNPLLALVAELLDLAAGRITASQVMDLASREPVRRRFHFDDDDLGRLEDWVAATGVRWGLDAAHRAPYGLSDLDANTWRAGLDRILLGVSMAEDDLRLVGGALPLDDVDSGDIDLAGRVAELIDRLDAALADLAMTQPVAAWVAAIERAADSLGATPAWDSWPRLELDRLLADVVAEAGAEAASATPLALPEVRSLLADRLRGRPTRANFRTGHLTMCTLLPMRSVPHRVVCLLGLDDGVFPRRTASDGDDLLEQSACIGDRDARSEDRQLLLDAVLAATDHLVVTYSGRDERTNAVLPPAVPVGELLDVVDRTARAPDGTPARDAIVVHHPLQPFDVRNFVGGALIPGGPWSFDRVSLDGAKASISARVAATTFLTGPLPALDTDVVELDDLIRFVQHPVRAFLRRRLGIVVGGTEDEPSDALPVELNALEQWSVGQRILEHRLAGLELRACVSAEIVRGTLPPGAFGRRIVDDVTPVVDDIVEVATDSVDVTIAPLSVDVDIELGDGRTLVGTVPTVVGDVVRAATYSRVGPRQRLASWVHLLAVTAGHPGRSFTAITAGRGRQRGAGTASIGPLGDDAPGRERAALAHLQVLVDLYARGMCEPLPLYSKTSAAYATSTPGSRLGRARSEWESNKWENEDRDAAHLLVLGGPVPFDELLLAPPGDGESGLGWDDGEVSRFGRLAMRLWAGLLGVEQRYNL